VYGPPCTLVCSWDIPGTSGVGGKVLEGPNENLFIMHGDTPNFGVAELNVSSDRCNPGLVRDYPARAFFAFDFDADENIAVVSSDGVSQWKFLTYSTADGSLQDSRDLMPNHKPESLVIGPHSDCNGNGVLDSRDIAEGTSLDCNGDGLPDECECQGDLDDDYTRDLTDFTFFAQMYGAVLGDADYDPNADFDCDGVIDLTDFTAFAANYGVPCP
jgi:hypothetical protein